MAQNRAQRRAQRKMKLNDLREQTIEAMGQISSMELEADNGEIFTVVHPLLVDDDTQERIEKFQAGEGLDKNEDGTLVEPHKINGVLAEPIVVRSAKAIMGDEEFARFKAAGGNAQDITFAWQEMVRDQKELIDEDPK